jgi:hypothetical protein
LLADGAELVGDTGADVAAWTRYARLARGAGAGQSRDGGERHKGRWAVGRRWESDDGEKSTSAVGALVRMARAGTCTRLRGGGRWWAAAVCGGLGEKVQSRRRW